MDKLKELLDGLVAEKSLSFEVLEQLRKVKTESEELAKNNFLLGENIKELDIRIQKLTKENTILTTEITQWKADEAGIVVRENAVRDIEHKNEIEKLKATHSESTLNQVKEIVGMVFKNTVVRETVNKNVGHIFSQNGNYPSTHTTCDNENKTTEEL